MTQRLIPVYVHLAGKDVLIQRLPADQAAHWVTLRRLKPIYGRRGHLKRVFVIQRLTGLIHLERTGYCREQSLSTGHVYALVDTPGSRDDDV